MHGIKTLVSTILLNSAEEVAEVSDLSSAWIARVNRRAD